MMRIALVNAPGAFLLAMPPATIAYLASYLRTRGHGADLFDCDLALALAQVHPDTDGEMTEAAAAMRSEDFFHCETQARYQTVIRRRARELRRALERSGTADAERVAEFLREQVACLVQSDVVGLSMTFDAQVPGAVFLARLLREVKPDLPIVAGGTAASVQHFKGMNVRVLRGDGEHPLADYLDALAGTKHELVRSTSGPHIESDLHELPAPDYGDLLRRYAYLTPEPVLPLAVTRGCYWGKCQFCAYGWVSGNSGRAAAPYRRLGAVAIADQMQVLADQHRARHFFFSVDVADPVLLRNLATILHERQMRLFWRSEMRAEHHFLQPGALEHLHAGGCRTLSFGLESLNQRVLDAMKKGTKESIAARLVPALAAAGIGANVDFFIGYPSETPAEAARTQRFVAEHSDEIVSHSAGGTFILFGRSPMARLKDVAGLRHDPALGWVKSGLTWDEQARQQQLAWANMCFSPTVARFPVRNDGPELFLFAARYAPGILSGTLLRERGFHTLWADTEVAFDRVFGYLLEFGARPQARLLPPGRCDWYAAEVQRRKQKLELLNLHAELMREIIDASHLGDSRGTFLHEVVALSHAVLESCLDEGPIPALPAVPASVDLGNLAALHLAPVDARAIVRSFTFDVTKVLQAAPSEAAMASAPSVVLFDRRGPHPCPSVLASQLFELISAAGGRSSVESLAAPVLERSTRAEIREALGWLCLEGLVQSVPAPMLRASIEDVLRQLQTGDLSLADAKSLLEVNS